VDVAAEAVPRSISEAVAVDDGLDAALVERVRGGESAAFDELVSRHTERAFRIAFRVMRHREDAEDLVQDAWIAALRADSGESRTERPEAAHAARNRLASGSGGVAALTAARQ
jgi:hypothetical protein